MEDGGHILDEDGDTYYSGRGWTQLVCRTEEASTCWRIEDIDRSREWRKLPRMTFTGKEVGGHLVVWKRVGPTGLEDGGRFLI